MAVGYRSPLGLNRWVLLGWYSVVLGMTGYIIGAVDPLKRLLWLNDCGKSTADNTLDQKNIIEFIVNRGYGSASAISLVVASLSSYRKPNSAAVISLVFFIVGLVLLFMGEVSTVNSAGMIIIAGTFSSSFNAHVCIGALFPTESEIAFDYLGSAPDLSTLVPLILLYGAESMGGEKPVETVVQIYIGIVLFLALSEYITLPGKPFSEMVTEKYKARMDKLPKPVSRISVASQKSKLVRRIRAALKREDDEDCALADLTLIQQVVHPMYWIVAAFFAFNMIRKYHVLSSFRFTIEQYARDGAGDWEQAQYIAEALNVANALSFIPTTFLSRLTSDAGSLTNTYVIAITGVLTTAVMSIPSVNLQWITVVLFWIWGSYIYGNLFCLMAEYFGLRHVSNLQGTQMMLGGLGALCYPYIMEGLNHPYIFDELTHANIVEGELPMFRMVHFGFTAIGALMCFVPLYEGSIAIPHIRKLRLTRDARRAQKQQEAEAAAVRAEQRRVAEVAQAKAAGAQQEELLMAQTRMRYEAELRQLLDMIREDRVPPNLTHAQIAHAVMQRMALLGIDPREVFGDDSDEDDGDHLGEEEDDEDEEEMMTSGDVQPISRLSVDGSSGGGRLMTQAERRRSISAIGHLGTGTAFLNERNVAEMAGTAIAHELANNTLARRRYSERFEVEEERRALMKSHSDIPVHIQSAKSDSIEKDRKASALQTLSSALPEGHPVYATPIAFQVAGSEHGNSSSPNNV